MKKIRVLHFIHSLSGGGAEKQLRLLAQELDTNQFDVEIFCINPYLQDDINWNAEVTCGKFKPSLSIKYITSIFNVIQKSNPDIVHLWLPASVTIPALLSSAILRRHIIFSYRSEMQFVRPLSYVEFLLALLFSEKVVSNRPPDDSHSAYKWLFKIKGGQVIYNAVLVPDVYQRSLSRFRPSIRFIFAGRLTQQKNVLQLIRALSMVSSKRKWFLDVYGVGEQRQEVEAAILEHKLSDRICVRGYCRNVYKELADSDALLFPSLWEGMPNIMFEALAIGLPVIASDIIPNRHVIGKIPCVVWIDPRSAADIADKVTAFLDKPEETREMVKAGKAVALQYSVGRMVDSYIRLYKSMLNKNTKTKSSTQNSVS